MSAEERRRMKRWNVAVLVRCSLPHPPNERVDLEMWAKDVNSKGLKLEWAHGLNATKINSDGESDGPHAVRFEDINFKKGAKIMVQDLFYDDDGSPFMEGKISWARKYSVSDNWGIGIQFIKNDQQTKDQLGAFKDFLSIIKNPGAAVARASKQNK